MRRKEETNAYCSTLYNELVNEQTFFFVREARDLRRNNNNKLYKYAKMLRDDNASGLSFAIIANVFFVMNCCLTHAAISYELDMANMLLVGAVVKLLFSHIQLKSKGLDYNLRKDKDTGLVLLC
jgi:hypothetical protein